MATSYTAKEIGKVATGTDVRSKSMIFKTDGPLDDRVAIQKPEGLIAQETFENKNYVYPGLTCSIVSTGDIYVLTNKNALTLKSLSEINKLSDAERKRLINLAWTKLPNAKEVTAISETVNNLSGIWQFKGVALAISGDSRVVTVDFVGVKGDSYFITASVLDALNETYYQLSRDRDVQDIGETDLYLKAGTTDVYSRPEVITAATVEYQDEVYYFDEENGNGFVFTSLSDKHLYTSDDIFSLDKGLFSLYEGSSRTIELPIKVYEAYSFKLYEKELAIFKEGDYIEARSDNNGWVFQIGEKEYASNGLMWVELGSPKQDLKWIVIS